HVTGVQTCALPICSHPALVDIDGDGDLDLVIGREETGALLYRNEGTRTAPRFVADTTYVLPLHPTSAPVFVDLDGDGSVELIAGGLSGGLTYHPRRGAAGVDAPPLRNELVPRLDEPHQAFLRHGRNELTLPREDVTARKAA